MRKVIFAAALLLTLITNSSCEKEGASRENLVGTWHLTSTDFYFDNKKISFNKQDDALCCLLKDDSVEDVYTPMDGIASLISYTFTRDGMLSIMGYEVAKWSLAGNKVILTPVESDDWDDDWEGDWDEDDGETGSMYLSNGRLYIEVITEVLGYQVIKDFDYDNADPKKWKGNDGKVHKLKQVNVLSK